MVAMERCGVWGYQAEIDDLRVSGTAAGEAAEQAAGVAAGDTLSEIRAAMPGSASAQAAGSLAEQWNAELSAWVDDMRRYAEDLHRSAELYESSDSAAGQAFGAMPVQRGRPEMPMWGEVKQWDAAATGRGADGLKKNRDRLVGLQQDLETSAAPRGWAGPAADAATERLNRETARLRRIVTAISAVFTGTAATDSDGITEWSPKWIGWLPGVPSMRVTVGEAEMLSDLQDHQGLKGGRAAYDIYKEALHQSESAFGGEGGTDGHADAFRHAYWNAMLTQRFGEEWAQEYATAHERNPDSHPTPVAMDLHNNEVGRRIALENPDADEEELRGLVEQAVRDGEMVVIGTDERLDHSNQVDLGDTRPTGKDHAWSTDNPERGGHRDPGDPDAYPERGY